MRDWEVVRRAELQGQSGVLTGDDVDFDFVRNCLNVGICLAQRSQPIFMTVEDLGLIFVDSSICRSVSKAIQPANHYTFP